MCPRGLTGLPWISGAFCRKFAGSPVSPRVSPTGTLPGDKVDRTLTGDTRLGVALRGEHCQGKLIRVIIGMAVSVVPYPDGAVPTAEEEKTT